MHDDNVFVHMFFFSNCRTCSSRSEGSELASVSVSRKFLELVYKQNVSI